mgnify:CR=1 FL=1
MPGPGYHGSVSTGALSFFTVDHGSAAISAALVAPVEGRFRMLAAATLPRDADAEALLADLVARVLAIDPGLLPDAAAWRSWIRLETRSSAPPRVVCAAPSERSLIRLERAFAAAGWEIAGSILPGDEDALTCAELLLDPETPAVAIAADGAGDDAEDAALPRLGGLLASALVRRPSLRLLSCGMPGDWDDRMPPGRAILLPPPADGPVARDEGLRAVLVDLAGRGRAGAAGMADGRAAFRAAVEIGRAHV